MTAILPAAGRMAALAPRSSRPWGVLGLAAAVAAATWLALACDRPPGGVTVLWATSGIVAGTLLTSPHRAWPLLLGAALLVNFAVRWAIGDALALVAARGVASTLDAAVVAWALRLYVGDVNNPAKLLRVARIAIVSTLAGCAASAVLAAAADAWLDHGHFLATLPVWFLSHALGMVVFATLTGVTRELGWSVLGRRGHYGEFVRTMALVAATAAWVFTQSHYPLLFLVQPPLMLAAFRHRFAGFAFGLAVVIVIAVAASLAGHGPLQLVPDSSLEERTLLLQVFIAVSCISTLPLAIVLAERARFAATLRASERSYRLLADHSHDLVVRMRADGSRAYVSPSIEELLGWTPDEVRSPRWDLIHPDDRALLVEALGTLLRTGNPATLVYRIQHKYGYYVWIEALATRVATGESGVHEIVYSGRDVSHRVQIEQALADNQRRLRAIADNLPALVAHVDTGERFMFVNTPWCEALDRGPDRILGHTMAEVLGWRVYNEVRPRVQAALRGEPTVFEVERVHHGSAHTYHATYVPDVADDGKVQGFIVLLFDITKLKHAERELAALARRDALTGLANRLQFTERLEQALARGRRERHALALLYLDIDRFKLINDTHGHAAGDAVLAEFAQRLRAHLRETDLPARLGGDEFAVLVEHADTPASMETIARKLLAAMQPPFAACGAPLGVGVSIGIGIVAADAGAAALMASADGALYAAKAAGRGTYRVATKV